MRPLVSSVFICMARPAEAHTAKKLKACSCQAMLTLKSQHRVKGA